MIAGSRTTTAHALEAPGPVSEDDFVRPWTSPALRTRLADVGFELPQQIGATFLGDADYLRELTRDAPPLDDNHPQRLRPDARRPSLSDPGYGVDPRVTALYQSVVDTTRARDAFSKSTFVKRLWPERIAEATMPFFARQNEINQVFWEGGRPLAEIDSLHHVLTETPLRTLPLWMLGSDAVKERIAAMRDDGSGAVVYARGLTSLVDRDYLRAASAFAEAEQRGLADATVRALRVYALCLAGHIDLAKQLAPRELPAAGEVRRYWEWLGQRYTVGPAAR
jgi:hypothetical protein